MVIASARKWANTILDGLGALAFPAECLICEELLPHPLGGPVCAACLEALPRLGAVFCPRCGLPYELGVVPGLCGPCRSIPRAFRRARAGFVYEAGVRRCLHALKFGGRTRLGGLLGEVAARRWVDAGELSSYAAVVPVPLSRRRLRERGFNQAEQIARAVARVVEAPLYRRVLFKVKERPPQAGLSAGKRLTNVASAYRARVPSSLEGRDVLLVDDVLTTGATAEAASSVLLASGVGAVDVLTLARVR